MGRGRGEGPIASWMDCPGAFLFLCAQPLKVFMFPLPSRWTPGDPLWSPFDLNCQLPLLFLDIQLGLKQLSNNTLAV